MLLLCGLGNPGSKYAGNRHNAGFMAVEAIADRWGAGPARQKFNGLLREGRIGDHRALFLRPQTFYNESGNAVTAALKFYKLSADDLIVFHDEIDLAPGKVKVKKGGGLAGNNGLKSIAAHAGPDFWRVRLGVGHPGAKDAVTRHVLNDFSKVEREEIFDDLFDRMATAMPAFLPPSDITVGPFMSDLAPPQPRRGAAKEVSESKPVAPKTMPQSPDAPKARSPFADALRALTGKKDS